MPLPTSSQQRDTIKKLSPPWLAKGNAERFLYTIGLGLDLLLEKENQGRRFRLPGQADASQLPVLADDLLLAQGPQETNAAFAARLQNALLTWQLAGLSRSVITQLQAYIQVGTPTLVGAFPEVLIVGGNATYSFWDRVFNTTPIGAPPAHRLFTPPNWDWDGKVVPKRAWVVLFFTLVPSGLTGGAATLASASGNFVTVTGLSGMTSSMANGSYLSFAGAANAGNNVTAQITQWISASSVVVANPTAVVPDANSGAISWSVGTYPLIGPAKCWGHPLKVWGDPTESWGLSCPQAQIDALRTILKRWKRASVYVPDIIVAFDGGDGRAGAMFSPDSTAGAGNPDGTWGPFAKTVNGCVVPSRPTQSPFDAFCDGTGVAVNCYEKTDT